ncbi:class F sortase [Pseudarthrobacter sp. NPDC058196]|uniref:class F sortase n=1 Tax=Pseudarthrobacter sp. NPDC058196 TaxID=3346376 RepID=UPI0036DC1E66
MPQERSRHAARKRRPWRRLNRGDLAILSCGVVAFLSITFGSPLFQQGHVPSQANATVSTPLTPGAVASGSADVPIAVTGTAGATPAPVQATPAAVPAGPQLPAAAQPVHIRYPSADFDVAIHPLDLDGAAQSSRTIEPPATKDGYWLTPFGIPGKGSGNTTYVIGHSWEGADAPFNHLSSAAAVGDRIEVETAAGTITYKVDSVTTYVKSTLKDSPVWDMVPNRLVLISCFTEDPWGKNVVVTAYPAAA